MPSQLKAPVEDADGSAGKEWMLDALAPTPELGIADETRGLRGRLTSLARESGASTDEAREAATELEAYFIKVLLGEMRKTLSGDSLFGGSSGDGYRALLDDALARHAARSGGIGLADQLTRQWEGRS